MRELRIIVGDDSFEPLPLRRRVGMEEIDEPGREHVPHLRHDTIAGERPQILVNRDEGKGPCPRRTEASHRRQTALEKQCAKAAMTGVLRPTEGGGDGPEPGTDARHAV